MDFYAGDIVRSLIDDGVGLKKGETGTVIKVNDVGEPYVRWDKYNKHRHNGYGDIPVGHGWFVGKNISRESEHWILVNYLKILISNFYLERMDYDR